MYVGTSKTKAAQEGAALKKTLAVQRFTGFVLALVVGCPYRLGFSDVLACVVILAAIIAGGKYLG